MDRKIIFRGLKDDMSNCNWVYGSLVYSNGIPRISNDEGLTFHTCVKGTEGQFTGLKDKKGVDIYEGDILKWTSSNPFSLGEIRQAKVYYVQAQFWCKGDIGVYLAELLTYEKCEIIGNIYENPELIK